MSLPLESERLRLIDVREPWEYQASRLVGAELSASWGRLSACGCLQAARPRSRLKPARGLRGRPTNAYRNSGQELRVANWLRGRGLEIDPAIPRYT